MTEFTIPDAARHEKQLALAAIAALQHFVDRRGNFDTALASADALLTRIKADREIQGIIEPGIEL